MNCYIIHYRLKDEKEYQIVEDIIKEYENYAHILTSCWAVITDENEEEIANKILDKVNTVDSVFVIKSSGEAAWYNVLTDDTWLEDNL